MIKSITYGADLINDVSGFNHDPYALVKLKNFNIPKVLHHMQGTPKTMQKSPKYKNVLLDIYDFFERKILNISNNKKIIIDPGIGFGKTLKHNLTLISKISLFHSLGFPILVGTSRKRFINQISGVYDSNDRTGGTLASVLYLLSQGVQIFRVHNVREVKQGIMVYEKLMKNKYFGTDGIRGTVNQGNITGEKFFKFGLASGTYFKNQKKSKQVAIIAKDTRLSGYTLEPALVSGLVSGGMHVYTLGPLPTNGLAMLTKSMKANMGIMITASHNPYHDNGLKLFGPDGMKLSDKIEKN